MKTTLFFSLFMGCILLTNAQIGIGNTDPKASLDITATNVATPSNEDGILIPRVDNFPATNPTIAQDGMMVFATGNSAPTKGFYYWDQTTTTWNAFTGAIDADWYEFGTTTPPNSINDNIYTTGQVYIGDGPPATSNSKLHVTDFNDALNAGLSVVRTHTNNTAFGHNGIYQFSQLQGSGSYNGVYTPLQTTGPTTATGAINNYSAVNNISRGAGIAPNILYHGIFNSNTGTSPSAKSYGSFLEYSTNATSAGEKYGYYIDIDVSLPAIHYGIYSDIQKPSGYAAYLIGRTSLGIGTTNRYLMPSSDGTMGQVMTTDGAGNVTFTTISTTDTQNTLDQAYDEGGLGLGRTISATNGAVLINGTDGFQNTGTFGSGATLALSGAGTKMFFHPRKAAFRAGYVSGTQWNDANIGDYSAAFGLNNIVSGSESVAFGNLNSVTGQSSLVFGYNNNESGGSNAVFGSQNDVSGIYNFVAGGQNVTTGENSFALGQNNTVPGDVGFAFGSSNNVTGGGSFAIGTSNTINSSSSFTIGTNLQAFSGFETVMGLNSTNYSPTNTTGFNNNDRLFVVGNGATTATRSNALTIYKDGRMNINDAYTMPTADGTANQVLTTNGAGNTSWTTPNAPITTSIMRANMSSTQVVPSSIFTKILFDTTLFDTNSDFDAANNRFVAPRDGYYRVNSAIGGSNGSSGVIYIHIYKNGVLYQRNNFGVSANGQYQTINGIVNLNAGEYVEIFAIGSPNHNVFTNYSFFEVQEIK